MPQTQQQLANALNPTPFNVNVPGNGVYSSGDAGQILIKVGNTLYQTGLDDLGRRYANTLGYAQGQRANESGAAATTYGTEYLRSLGLDPGGLQKLGGAQVADLLGNAGKLGLSFSNNLDLTNLPSLLKTPTTQGTTTALNTQSNQLASPSQLADASAAQNKQLAGYQGMNVVQSTTPEGIPAVTKTPLANTVTLDSLKQQLIGAQNSLSQMGAPPQIPGSLASSDFSSVPSYNFQTPQQTPIYPVSTLGGTVNPNISSNGQLSLTSSEQQGQSLSEQLQALNNQLLGESSYRTGQENAAGLPQLIQTQRDLTSQLNALKNEAQAIPLQAQNQAEGRGITTGGLRPIEAAAARNNAIQALSINALLEATNGNIATAQTLVDRAVAQQFDPIREKITAATNNLNLIINSPKASVEEKNRAQAQLDIQNAKKDALDQAKKMQSDIYNIAIDAATQGASASVLQQINAATTPQQALQIAAAAGIYNKPVAGTGAGGSDLTGAPNSYKEWTLAGKPGTYEQWLKDSNVKAPTVAQQTVATYASRIEQANPTISNLESTIQSMNPLLFEAQSRLPSYLQTATYQQFDQAARNFINAVLRRESGAVISPSEFDNAYKQYLPRAGDTEATLMEKRINRDIVYNSLKNAAGGAYQSVGELLGSAPTSSSSGGSFYKGIKVPN